MPRHILTRDQELAEAKYHSSCPSNAKSAGPAEEFYAGLQARALPVREERKLMWSIFLSSDENRA